MVVLMGVSGGNLPKKPPYSNLKIDSTISIDSCIERIYLSCDIDTSILQRTKYTINLAFFNENKFVTTFHPPMNEDAEGRDSVYYDQFKEIWNGKYHLLMDRNRRLGRYVLDRKKQKFFVMVIYSKKDRFCKTELLIRDYGYIDYSTCNKIQIAKRKRK